uniref:Protein kinase domain-containing protein n=1 Tax=Physcomitrium patens TaxID=3218 RepID=A0A7I4D5Y0_PHYPA
MARQKFALLGIAIVLSLHVFSNFLEQVEAQDNILLPAAEQWALRNLFVAWKNTEDLNSSLPGWTDFNPDSLPNRDTPPPIDGLSTYDPCYFNSWRGVRCYITLRDTTPEQKNDKGGRIWDANVVTIIVSDESIIGNLPEGIWNFTSLSSLTLTGNPELKGVLPPFTGSSLLWTLKNLDLHGNGLHGSIPSTYGDMLSGLEDLDLSNNRLNGALPENLGKLEKLWTLKLSHNQFSGSIPRMIFRNLSRLVTMNMSFNAFNGSVDLLVNKTNLDDLDLSNNYFTGSMPNLSSWSNLQSLNLSNNKFDPLDISASLQNVNENLLSLGLSNTSLHGTLSTSMLKRFTKLRTIELDYNNIDGTLDVADLLSFPLNGTRNSTLRISLRNNSIDTVIYKDLVRKLPLILELQGNPYCSGQWADSDVGRCFCTQLCFDSKAEEDIANVKRTTILIASLVCGILLLIIISIGSFLIWKNRRDSGYRLAQVHEKFAKHELKPTLYSYGELQKATNDFHPYMKLGEGAFGAVYKGKLADGSVVAVKQLTTNAQQNMDDFLNEVVVLTTVKHRNLVKLKGCCLRGDRRLLVYECVENYDLAETLFDHKGNQPITWPKRFNICLGVANGLQYLHEGVEPRIIHRDIKANNVLLDKNLQPKIADFGLALLFPNQETHITIEQIAGTKGYMAPEYASLGQISERVDVFSFGVLALEVVSGRRNINFDVPLEKTYLSEWAWKLNEAGSLLDLVDPSLSLHVDEEAVVLRVINVAMACLQTAAERRPTMGQVVAMLQGDIEVGGIVRERYNENVNRSYQKLLGLNTSVTSLVPVEEEESQVLYGSSSQGGGTSHELELSLVKAR